ncbi:MAG TPA: tyrosine-type recombinase/integrase [Geminicoccaceae bacterium]|nr:tyrosine-type recombinase/integrase [Geminicoccus sp.]HMU50245.1 tyrosine-type recombinase/integrase [Geminicoccaceae bacterium]
MSKYPPTRLTEGFIKGLPLGERPYVVRDTKVTGLMVAVNTASKSYKVQRDLWTGERGRRKLVKTVRRTLGLTTDLTLDAARERAEAVLAQVRKGVDPNAPPVAPDEGSHGWTVARMYDEYQADLRTRSAADRTIEDVTARLERYLPKWKARPIAEIKRSEARQEHQRITVEHGSRVANQALKDFRAAYNLALRVVDDPDALPANPVAAVTFNKERASGRVLMPDELPEWWQKVQELPNPIRRAMHTLGLLSGLRPGKLVSLRREWLVLGEKAILIPRMKSGRSFALPLSDQMVETIKAALAAGDVLHPGSPWLFPTRSNDGRKVIATQVWKEKELPSQTGHILRHTYRTICQLIGIDKINARLLLDHAVPGIDGVYIHERALFDKLLTSQSMISSQIMALCKAEKAEKGFQSLADAA